MSLEGASVELVGSASWRSFGQEPLEGHVRARTRTVATATSLAVVVAAAPAVGADEMGEHCVLEVVGVADDGELLTSEPFCYATLAEVLDAAGPSAAAGGSVSAGSLAGSEMQLQQSGTIARHFAGSNRTGASITITGTDCGGGWLNLSSDWVNRISSTQNFCPVVRFFDGFDKSGASETTGTSTVNLGPLNNRANSVSYGS